MKLEEIILELTSKTESGGTCRFGDISFKVWYCSDIWEWEYEGETYWDPMDLADAISRSGKAALQDMPSPATRTKARARPLRTHRPPS